MSQSTTDIHDAADRALDEVHSTYKDTYKDPANRGVAWLDNLPTDTTLYEVLRDHEGVRVMVFTDTARVDVKGFDPWFPAQRAAHDVFKKMLQTEGIDAASDMRLRGRTIDD